MIDVIIIGAGASGLHAARQLSHTGKSVVVLEARNRIGGRIHTLAGRNFSGPVEAGAEFIHGDLPLTKALMGEADVSHYKGHGAVWKVDNGQLEPGSFFEAGWDEVIRSLKSLREDMTIAEFLTRYFGGEEHKSLRESILQFVQGYDAADATKASAFALRDEWSGNDDITGYHPKGGYGQLMEYLHRRCLEHDVIFHHNAVVQEVRWKRGYAEMVTESGERYISAKVIVTIPPAVLRTGRAKFIPPLVEHSRAVNKIETGGVLKFLFEFKDAFWEKEAKNLRAMSGLHFLFSDATIPTWWTQKPRSIPLLTGWLAGPVTQGIHKNHETLLADGLHSLAYLFACEERELQQRIHAAKVVNWANDPFSMGAYAYKTLDTTEALKVLAEPVDDTVYFAGEAYYAGPEMGTVEAALASAAQVAERIAGKD
ncbi:MAG TPA: NAD(P)/FAD-dependent oxidoreductase [Ohtaekwangia sp.]|nr:NAD(P)/FAD-dependent oxidoreductase [Ohtaekwangia sp.]